MTFLLKFKKVLLHRLRAGKPSYYGAVYEFLTDDTGCEGEIGIREVSGVEFEDEGHAIEWAMKNAN
ncbi:hypothetical protein [uncultured Ruminobacter sp.]|uniref:Nmad4 family putative nucleotide modification protein n=1 Tax=uncultured Ruminobacter sp. TaxID=538947 RepID=UPI0025D6A7D5|nr:hypothetical protein [uncultured Ruminobacter sp.]